MASDETPVRRRSRSVVQRFGYVSVPSRGSHAAGTRGTGSPTQGHCHPGVSPHSTPEWEPRHPTSPPRAFGRAGHISSLQQPCAGIATIPVGPHGLAWLSRHPTRVPMPWVTTLRRQGHPRWGGWAGCHRGLQGVLAVDPVSGPALSVWPLAVRWLTLSSWTWASKDAAPSGACLRGVSVTARGYGLYDGHFNA